MPSRREKWQYRVQSGIVGVCGILVCVAVVIAVPIYWAEHHILTTNSWVALVSPLPKEKMVSEALGRHVSERLLNPVPLEESIANALPEKAGFLAAPLAEQVRSVTTRLTQSIVASDGFQTVWEGAHRVAMNRLLETARGQQPTLGEVVNQHFDINLDKVRPIIYQALGSTEILFPHARSAAQDVVAISVDLQARIQRLRQTIQTVDTLAAVLPFLIGASLLLMLALSRRRRQSALWVSFIVLLLLLSELIAIRWGRQETLNAVNDPRNLAAIGYIYDVLVKDLRQLLMGVAFFIAVVIGGLVAAGPARWAVTLRSFLRLSTVRNTHFYGNWRAIRAWIARWEYYLWGAGAGVVFVSMALFVGTITNITIVNALFCIVSIVAVIHILATPRLPLESVTHVTAKKQ